MKTIEVIDFFADTFNKENRSVFLDLNFLNKDRERTYRLINEALKDQDWPEWDVNNGQYRSKTDNEPCCFEYIDDKFYIYGMQRGKKYPTALFESSGSAADYFVWLASEGTRKIDWSLFLDMLD